tara:strand:- start:469 stop:897 length:429 start_codon:yes stop_codon:yes gene_type:complete
MKDELIQFETAKLAKEKGFNEDCDMSWCTPVVRKFVQGIKEAQYIERKPSIVSDTEIDNLSCGYGVSYKDHASAPTQSLLQKWLREEHYVYVENNSCIVSISAFETFRQWNTYINDETDEALYDTYELALESGLFNALKLLP